MITNVLETTIAATTCFARLRTSNSDSLEILPSKRLQFSLRNLPAVVLHI
jgi:hypothetical protein